MMFAGLLSRSRKGPAMLLLAAVVLAWAGPALSARPAFLSDLEKSANAGGRKLKQVPVEIVEFDVVEVFDYFLDEDMFGKGYGGYGVYGYYGFGKYAGYGPGSDFFMDYQMTDDVVFGEFDEDEVEDALDWDPREDPARRRAMMEMGGKEIPGIEEVGEIEMPWAVADVAADFEYFFNEDAYDGEGAYGVYGGLGYGFYYGTYGVYAGIYGGEWYLDENDVEGFEAYLEDVSEILEQVTEKLAGDDLDDAVEAGTGMVVKTADLKAASDYVLEQVEKIEETYAAEVFEELQPWVDAQ